MFDIILIHGLAMIGVIVSLLFLCKAIILIILYIKRNGNPSKNWSIVRHCMFSENCDNYWFIIPTIAISFSGKAKCEYIEITVRFLKWEFYTNYTLSNEV